MLFFERERPENEWNKIKLNKSSLLIGGADVFLD